MYCLFLDDLRELSYIGPKDISEWKIARSSSEAIGIIKEFGFPEFISFDHDLGEDDTATGFLKCWICEFPDVPFPKYAIHSSNPIGSANIKSFIDSYNRSLEM